MIWFMFAMFVGWMLAMCAFAIRRGLVQAQHDIISQPCVSDEEFCKLMPEISKEVAMGVRSVLVDVSGWDREEIHPETRIIEFDSW